MLTIPFIVLALWLPAFLTTPAIVTSPEPLYKLLLTLTGYNSFILTLLALLSVMGQCYFINMIVVNEDVLDTTSHFPGFCYALLLSSFPQLLVFNPILIANWFILMVVYKLFTTYRKETAFFEVFDAGLCIGIASLIYFPSIILFLLIWVGLIIIRPFIWREWVIPLIGFIVPYLFVAVFYFWFNRLKELNYIWQPGRLTLAKSTVELHQLNSILLALFALLILCSFFKARGGIRLSSIRSRGNFSILLWLAYLSPFSLLFLSELSIIHFSFLAITFSVLISNYFMSLKRTIWAELLFFFFIIIVILVRFLK